MNSKFFRSCGGRVGWLLGHTFLVVVGMMGICSVYAQVDSGASWSEPERVVHTGGVLVTSGMDVISDGFGRLLVFFPHRPSDALSTSIDYVYWNDLGWSQPLDIVFEDGEISHIRAAIDSQQVVHLLWHNRGRFRYANSPLMDVSLPQAWSDPVSIGEGVSEGDIVVGPDDALYVTYCDQQGNIFLITSNGGGRISWEAPSSIVASQSHESVANQVRLAIDDAGRLHVVWTEYQLPKGWPPLGAYYTRSLDGGKTWEVPTQVAGTNHGQIGVATVGNDEVHLVWRTTIGGDGTFHRWSHNGGGDWSYPDQYKDRGGFSGLPSFVVDSAGTLHWVIGSAYTASWQDGEINFYVDVTSESLRTGAGQGESWTSPERAVIGVTSGNRLHVLFETGAQNLWHTTRLINAPEISVTPLSLISTDAPQGRDPSDEVVISEPRATLVPSLPTVLAPPIPIFPLIVGVGPVLIIVLLMILWNVRRAKK